MKQNEMFDETQFLASHNASFIADLCQKYKNDKTSVPQEWHSFIESINVDANDFVKFSWPKNNVSISHPLNVTQPINVKDIFIKYGHMAANLGALSSLGAKTINPDLQNALQDASAQQFQQIYCNTVGLEIDHITNKDEYNWLVNEFEKISHANLQNNEKAKVLTQLIEAQTFERFIHTKFPGMKRFSIEGGESGIVAIHAVLEEGNALGANATIIGMAHRGRLNVLTHITNKPYSEIFAEFAKNVELGANCKNIMWDVKYHSGYKTIREYNGSAMEVEVAFNPSHLEAVNPVVAGMAYAKNKAGQNVLPILIHGDAAMIGQGIVSECFNMSGINGYNCGGTLHIVINNQIGFTAEAEEARTSRYCTDVAKIIECPIFHINGEDVENCYKIAKLASKYRAKFNKDFVIDIICSRKYGHNEGDEPLYTNPSLYAKIANYDVVEKYLQNFDKNFVDDILNATKKKLDLAYDNAQKEKIQITHNKAQNWVNIPSAFEWSVKTGINNNDAMKLIDQFFSYPQNFTPNTRLAKQIKVRHESIKSSQMLDWAAGEMLAFASLVSSGASVRITGQDAARGTFSHRHSILSDSKTGAKYNILSPLFTDTSDYEVYNSPLSEFAVLGFEYGYSITQKEHLVIWEAQFGDFANGASTIFDQFISSGEQKWMQKSALTMLLPHGFEGQGPEHSSARLERYLQLCANDNIIVANCTTPANIFHILRRQTIAKFRKPLVIMSPKSLLRHKSVLSHIDDFAGEFMPIIPDAKAQYSKATKLILTSGKIYYDLVEKNNTDANSIIRIEQYYPFPDEKLINEIAKYKNLKQVLWVQEEPRNMGAWWFIREKFDELMSSNKINIPQLSCIARQNASSPATGFEKIHAKEQEHLIIEALA